MVRHAVNGPRVGERATTGWLLAALKFSLILFALRSFAIAVTSWSHGRLTSPSSLTANLSESFVSASPHNDRGREVSWSSPLPHIHASVRGCRVRLIGFWPFTVTSRVSRMLRWGIYVNVIKLSIIIHIILRGRPPKERMPDSFKWLGSSSG